MSSDSFDLFDAEEEEEEQQEKCTIENIFKCMERAIKPEDMPHLARDDFLKKLLEELELPETEASKTSSSQSKMAVRWRYSVTSGASLISRLSRTTKRFSTFSTATMTASGKQLSVLTGRIGDYAELHVSLKRSSIYYLFYRIIGMLRIMHHFADGFCELHEEDVPDELFSWSLEKFYKRRETNSILNLDVLLRQYSEDSLDWAKLRTDVAEVLRYYKFFYEEFVKGTTYSKTMENLCECKKMLDIENILTHTVEESKKALKSIADRVVEGAGKLWKLREKRRKRCVQEQRINQVVQKPIEWRYIRDSYAVTVEMEGMKESVQINKIQREIDDIREKTRQANLASRSTLLSYDYLTHLFNQQIKAKNSQLESDLDHWDDKILTTQFQLSQAREDLKLAHEGLKFMTRRIAEMHEKSERDRLSKIIHEQKEQDLLKAKETRKLQKAKAKKLAKKRKRFNPKKELKEKQQIANEGK